MPDPKLTVDNALALARDVLHEGAKLGLAPLSAVVLDAGGVPVATLRHHAAGTGRHRIAEAKATSCLAMGFGGRELARRAKEMPGFYAALGGVLDGGMLPAVGGALIRDQAGTLLGAVGVSGDTGANDERCVLAAIAASGFVADVGADPG